MDAARQAPAACPVGALGMLGGPDLTELLRATATCQLQACRFFVSWQGVLTLAYKYVPSRSNGCSDADVFPNV